MSISAAEYLRRVNRVRRTPTLEKLAFEVIIKDEKTIKVLKEQDFLEGDIYGDGTPVPYQSFAYSDFKARMNPQAQGMVDLILSGAFVEAMFVRRIRNNVYLFGNNDWKRNLLESKYSKKIFGLNQTVFDKFQREILAPRYIRLIKSTANIG